MYSWGGVGEYLSYVFENLTFTFCKFQKWKEQVKVSKYQKFRDLIQNTVALVKFLKKPNSTERLIVRYPFKHGASP